MRGSRLASLALAVVASTACGAASIRAANSEEGTLRICLNEDVPPFSVRNPDGGAGFDLLISQALAKRLGRRLVVQWFESKLDEDSSSTLDANALLSDGRCELLGGYPLMKDALGKPGLETAKLPDFAGARPADRRRRVTLGELSATTPYHFAALTVVLAGEAATKRITSLRDLDGVEVGIESGTLGDAILMTFDHGRLIPHITHFVPGRGDLFPRMEKGEIEATLVAVHRFDAYRIEHPDTTLRPSAYYLPIGFNMGFVGLASGRASIEQVNSAIEAMLKDGEPLLLAEAAHMTYLPPRQPYIRDGISWNELSK